MPSKRSSRGGEPGDWRARTLDRIRTLIEQADPDVVEEVKWRKPLNPAGVPVWSHDGIVCTGETYRDKVKITFAKGASLDDPKGLFNASLEGSTRRAIDLRESDELDAPSRRWCVRRSFSTRLASGGKAKPKRGK